MPARLRAPSTQAICMPKQMPKNGTLRSRAKRIACDLALRAALAEGAGHEDGVQRLEPGGDIAVGRFEQFGIDPLDVDLDPVGQAAMDQRFVQRLVGIRQADIFADHADRHFAFGIVQPVDDIVPAAQVGREAGVMPKARSTSKSRPSA